ncbi:MAG TPA: carbon-nitrogen hydrolase family protein [Planctomycetota bacterium]|jgi:predicted amidohydrolase|nr:carbon-nitrogen hydrolase family protein [Planctomycetota bacterium]
MRPPLRAAVAQVSPVLLDRAATVEKACDWIRRAAGNGARIVAFPETLVPAYPLWCDAGGFSRFDSPAAKDLHARLIEESVEVPSEATRALGAAAKESGVVVSIGVNERDARARTLWNALLLFDADGRLALHHRKLVPTFGERLVWAPGDAAGVAVAETAVGRVGGLVCWEHWMPAPRQVLHDAGEEIHAAAWPHLREMYGIASRHYAFEGRCFVLAAGSVLPLAELARARIPVAEFWRREDLSDPMLVGGSAIVAPDGRWIAGPAGAEETLLLADLDLDELRRESLTLDTGGHYARPDVFHLHVDRRRAGPTTLREGETPGGR